MWADSRCLQEVLFLVLLLFFACPASTSTSTPKTNKMDTNSANKMKTVGILGGMGPAATILLQQKVLEAVEAKDDADHVPLHVHQNPAVPSRIKALIEKTGESPGPTLQKMAQQLQAAGVHALAMPCNTAHWYASEVQAATNLPFLNMIELTAQQLTGSQSRKIGLLASPAVRETKIFERYITGESKVIYPQDDGPLLEMIRAIKKGGDAQEQIEPLAKIARELLKECDHVLVACTELSLVAPHLPNDIPWTDSLDCLVKGIVEFAKGN